MLPADDGTTVAEPGAARSLPAPHRDGGSAAPPGHAALQPSRDSRGSSTGAVTQTHEDDDEKMQGSLVTKTQHSEMFASSGCLGAPGMLVWQTEVFYLM